MMYVSFSLPLRFFGMMRLPAMYFFLCGQFFSFSHSGISAMASRFLIPCLSVLAIRFKKMFVHNTIAGAIANNEMKNLCKVLRGASVESRGNPIGKVLRRGKQKDRSDCIGKMGSFFANWESRM